MKKHCVDFTLVLIVCRENLFCNSAEPGRREPGARRLEEPCVAAGTYASLRKRMRTRLGKRS